MPDLEPLVDPLLGAPYADYNCWQLVRHLYRVGWGIDFDADPAAAVAQMQEIYFQGAPCDPLTLTQPWDVWVMRIKGMASSHVSIVFNTQYFIHARKSCGVCLEPLRRWTPRLLQIARLRRLL
jgi:hypothetical protein